MRVQSSLRFALFLVRTNLRASLALRAAFLTQCLLMALNNIIYFSFWWLLFREVSDLRGWQLPDVATLFGIAACGCGLTEVLAGGVRTLALRIFDGDLDVCLTQPREPLLQSIASHSRAAGWGDLATGLIYLAVSGHVDAQRIAPALIAIVASAIVLTASNVIYQSAAFWLGRIDALARMAFEVQLNFSMYPDALFGGALRLLLFTAIPAGFVTYLPASLVREPRLQTLAAVLAGALLYALAARAVFERGLRRYASGSRFGIRA